MTGERMVCAAVYLTGGLLLAYLLWGVARDLAETWRRTGQWIEDVTSEAAQDLPDPPREQDETRQSTSEVTR